MKHQIGLSPVWTSCSVRPRLAGRRPTGSQNWSRGFVSGFESGPLSKLNTCGFNFPFFLAFFSIPLLRPCEETRKIVCRVDSATPFPLPKKICLSRAPESSGFPNFHCTLQLKEEVPRQGPRQTWRYQPGSLSYWVRAREFSIFSPTFWGTTREAFLKVLGCRHGWSVNAQ